MSAPLDAVVARLEAVAGRLERLEVTASNGAPRPAAPAAAAVPPPGAAAAPAAPAPAAPGSPLAAYDALLAGPLARLAAAGAAAGGEVAAVTECFKGAYTKQRDVLAAAQIAKQPSMGELQVLLGPVGEDIMAVSAMAEDRRTQAFQQLKVAAESLNALSWLAYTGPACGMPAPPQHIGDAWASAEFYANKLMMSLRGKDEAGLAWVKGVKELHLGLQQLVRQHYPAGLKFDPAGVPVAEAQKRVAAGAAQGAPTPAAAAAPAAGRGPPPPPLPPVELLLKERPAAGGGGSGGGGGGSGGGLDNVLKQLQGAGATAGLRKVTDDMKAKNRSDRSGVVPSGGPPPAAPPAPAARGGGPAMGTPKVELQQDRKWVVEHHSANREIVIEGTDPKHVVYIFNCHNSVIQVRGKVNAVSIDSCKRTGVVFEHVIATCELVNCSSMQVQCLGAVPTVSVDKCDGAQVFVTEETAAGDFQLVTAKSSEVNLTVVPDPETDRDAVEHAVPEQFISSFQGGRLVTVAASHGGG